MANAISKRCAISWDGDGSVRRREDADSLGLCKVCYGLWTDGALPDLREQPPMRVVRDTGGGWRVVRGTRSLA